jgi:hypothetical protein
VARELASRELDGSNASGLLTGPGLRLYTQRGYICHGKSL